MFICKIFDDDIVTMPPIKRIMELPYANIEGDILGNKHISLTISLDKKDWEWFDDVARWIEDALVEKYEREFCKPLEEK